MLFCGLLIIFKTKQFFPEYHQNVKRFGSRCFVGLILIQTVCKGYQQTILGGKELNAHADKSSRATGLNFNLSHYLHSYFVCASSEGFAQVRLTRAFVSWQRDKHQISCAGPIVLFQSSDREDSGCTSQNEVST